MKYMAEHDGAIFTDPDECRRYELIAGQQAEVEAEVDRYLKLKNWPEDEKSAAREKTKAKNHIMGWLNHDMRQNGWRYGIKYDEPTPKPSIDPSVPLDGPLVDAEFQEVEPPSEVA